MGTSQTVASETERLTNLATNDERTPESRILSARALLRHTQFADRSCRVAKRIAKAYMENLEASAIVRTKAARLFMFAAEKKIDPAEEAQEVEAEQAAAAVATDPSLPADFNKPYFSRLILEYSTNKEAQQKEYDDLSEQARAKFGDQPTHEKITTEKASWERTPAYLRARRDHKAARDLVDVKYALHWRSACQ
jgi:hypothetical protein